MHGPNVRITQIIFAKFATSIKRKDMTSEERQEIIEIVYEVLNEIGASVENQEEVPTVETITDNDTTMPFINRSGGVATGYVQIKITDLAAVVASKIDPATAFPGKMDAISQEDFDTIFYPSDDSSDDSSE
jgi:hypothetical protein